MTDTATAEPTASPSSAEPLAASVSPGPTDTGVSPPPNPASESSLAEPSPASGIGVARSGVDAGFEQNPTHSPGVSPTSANDVEEHHTYLTAGQSTSESKVPSVTSTGTDTSGASVSPAGVSPASAGGSPTASASSGFPSVVAGQEYDDEMSYFKETQHGRNCSKPGGVYDDRGACGVAHTMKELLSNPNGRVSVPQYLWNQFLSAGGGQAGKSGICGSTYLTCHVLILFDNSSSH